MSSSMPWAQCNSPAGEVGSHLRGEEHPAAAKLHILQFQHGLPWRTSRMHILLWKIFATDVKASPSCACSSQAQDQHKHLQESDGFKMLILSATLTTQSQFLAHRLVAPKIILTKRPSRVGFPFPPVLLQEQVPGMIHCNKPMALCTHQHHGKQRNRPAGILGLHCPGKVKRCRHRHI